MSPAFRGAIALALLGCAGSALPASAQTTADYATQVVNPFFTNVDHFTTTTTAGGPTFNRPGLAHVPGVTAPPTALSGGGTAVAYAAHEFNATADGVYRVTTTINSGYADPATSASGTDNFVQAIYSPGEGNVSGFDPTMPLSNAALAYSQGASGDSYSVGLGAGSKYTFVNTGYYNANFTDSKLSVGTATTDIDLENFGSVHFIPDATTLGDPGIVSQTLHISNTGILDSFNSFSFVGLENDAVGDLTATLSHNGISVDLFARPDTPATADNFGSLASFNASQTYTFADSGADLGKVARGTVDAQPDPSVSYFPILGGTYQSLGSLSAFAGTSLSGDWKLTVKDSENSAGSAFGDFLGFSFNATSEAAPVPEASTFVSMAMGCGLFGLILIQRRRAAQAQSTSV